MKWSGTCHAAGEHRWAMRGHQPPAATAELTVLDGTCPQVQITAKKLTSLKALVGCKPSLGVKSVRSRIGAGREEQQLSAAHHHAQHHYAGQEGSQNHRITEWFGLEGTLKIIRFQPPCHEQGHLPPDQAAQSSIQPGLEHCQGGGSHSFSEQPVPVPHHPHGEEFLPII